jgi:putative ubiquitin-RnfH superfamily antitoxin RatB of RatAB toxin-antitoxin module
MARNAGGGTLSGRRIVVGVAWVTPGIEQLVQVELPAGATAGDAVGASGLVTGADTAPADLSLAIFGKRAERDTLLEDGDRVEICRPLAVDPGEARRLRASAKARRGSRATDGERDLPGTGN